MTPFQIDASSKAPCTRTTVGFWNCNPMVKVSPCALILKCSLLRTGSGFMKHRLTAVVADEIQRNAKRDDVFEEKEAEVIHIPESPPRNGRVRCGEEHGAGDEEHQRGNQSSDKASFRAGIADDE